MPVFFVASDTFIDITPCFFPRINSGRLCLDESATYIPSIKELSLLVNWLFFLQWQQKEDGKNSDPVTDILIICTLHLLTVLKTVLLKTSSQDPEQDYQRRSIKLSIEWPSAAGTWHKCNDTSVLIKGIWFLALMMMWCHFLFSNEMSSSSSTRFSVSSNEKSIVRVTAAIGLLDYPHL